MKKGIFAVILIMVVVFVLIGRNEFKKDTQPAAPEPYSRSSFSAPQSKCETGATLDYYYYEAAKTEYKNNKFGLYIYAENKDFFKLASQLVNSNGGGWGYVLIPYNVKDRDESKWASAFDKLNEYHLIPIIQLWDADPSDYEDDTKDAAKFLNRFLWPIKTRYVSAYNEPNDAKFWKGHADPKSYAKVLAYTIDAFKEENPDFFILNGAFNTSAPTTGDYMDAFDYMAQMNEEVPGVFEKLDGWASHPYPQPNFAGGVYATGRWSITAYRNELLYLKEVLGVAKDLPVFITETGWAHAEGENWNASYLPVTKVAENYKNAYPNVWLNDARIVAVAPFTIRYDPPFDHFSWVNKDNVPYLHFQVVKSLQKVAGEPPKLIKAKLQIPC